MSEDRLARMYRQMLEDLEKLSGKWTVDFQEETSKWVQDLLRGTFDPARMMEFLRGMRVDMPQAGTMPQGFDPYRVLGLDKSASDEEVRQAYRKVMSAVHPDKAGPELTFLAAIVNAAYKMIERERRLQ